MLTTTALQRTDIQSFLKSTTALAHRTAACLASLSLAVMTPAGAFAAPVFTAATAGTTVSAAGATTTVNQTTARAILDWSNFDTTSAETIRFVQPNIQSIALNRVSGPATNIQGQIRANGKVVVINTNGIHVNGARVSAHGGFIASTRGITDTAGFLAGNNTLVFDQAGEINATVRVTNSEIIVNDNKQIALIGQQVTVNNSKLTAKSGAIGIAAGQKVTVSIDPVGDDLLSFVVNDPVLAANMANAIEIGQGSTLDVSGSAANIHGGKVLVTADAMNAVYDNVIRIAGDGAKTSIKAHSMETNGKGGKVQINARARNSQVNGDLIHIAGDEANTDGRGGEVKIDAHSATALGGQIQLIARAANSPHDKLIDIDTRVRMDATSTGDPTKDGTVEFTALNNGAADNNGVSLDGESIFSANAATQTYPTGTRHILEGDRNSLIQPCAVVNGVDTCAVVQVPTPNGDTREILPPV